MHSSSPVVHVLAQLVFPPTPAAAAGGLALRQPFFDLGYERAQEHTVEEWTVTAGPAPSVVSQPRTYCTFADRDHQNVFTVTAESLVLNTSAYERHEALFERLHGALAVFFDAWKVPYVDRIGLRYVNLMQFRDGDRLSRLIAPELLGFPFRARGIPTNKGNFATNSLAITDAGVLSLRSSIVGEGDYLPPDLNPIGLRRPAKVDPTLPGVLLDFDHFTVFSERGESPLNPEPDAIVIHLQKLHGAIKTAFTAALTPEARAAWDINDSEARP